jgi:hypothetical protein
LAGLPAGIGGANLSTDFWSKMRRNFGEGYKKNHKDLEDLKKQESAGERALIRLAAHHTLAVFRLLCGL